MQLANFAIVAFAVWKLAYKPLLAKMDEREKKISDGLAFSENAEKKMEEMKKKKPRSFVRPRPRHIKLSNRPETVR